MEKGEGFAAYEKPFTENMKQRANTLYAYLKEHDWVSKEEVCGICGVASERQARDIIAALASRRPIISSSDKKGYRLAKSKEDIEEVDHALKELSSRVEEIQRRMMPLYDFRAKVLYNIEPENASMKDYLKKTL